MRVIIGVALLLGLVTAFGSPAMNAIVPSLVNRDDLPAAIAMNSVTFNMARAVGPVLGALVVAARHPMGVRAELPPTPR